MSRLYRTLLGIQSGPPVGTFAVTFTVKEWFLDPDNSFIDTEIAALHYMTVNIVGIESKLTNAQGQAIFNLQPGTYTWQVFDNARYLTTRQGSITVTDSSIVVDVKIYACLYKPTEVWDMINNEGYVPVATAAELDGLRNTGSRTMGSGTVFVGSYAVIALSGKNIQVATNIKVLNWGSIGTNNSPHSGTYDGNELFVQVYGDALFFAISSSLLKNIRLYVEYENTLTQSTGGLARGMSGVSIIDNCIIYGNIINHIQERTGGIIGSLTSGNCTIINSGCFVNITCSTPSCGGLVGYNQGSSISNSFYIGTINASHQFVGGIVGWNNPGEINGCFCEIIMNNNGNPPTYVMMGGIVGRNWQGGNITKCSVIGEINYTGALSRGLIGGIAGFHENTISTNIIISNCWSGVRLNCVNNEIGGLVGTNRRNIVSCYSCGEVIGVGSSVGGLSGANTGTITNCYYDTQTSGRSDTGKGLPRTTAQLQAGTASSFINPDGTIDGTQNAANAMFTGWDNNTWNFQDNTKYPKLK
jgi:hypothetical protein